MDKYLVKIKNKLITVNTETRNCTVWVLDTKSDAAPVFLYKNKNYRLCSVYECFDSLVSGYDLSKTIINRFLRLTDRPNLWPIRNKFNVAERAIRKTGKLFPGLQGLEYCLAVDNEIGRIVNDERNW